MSPMAAIDPGLAEVFGARQGWTRRPSGGPPHADPLHLQRRGGGRAGRGSAASRSARALVANARGLPQAVVKITRAGRTSGGKALAAQLAYLGRRGEIQLQDEDRASVDPGRAGGCPDLVDDWQSDFERLDARATFTTYHVVMSYPEGSDPARAAVAARDFAEELTGGRFGDRWRYVLAHHRDTANPHSHLILNRMGEGGRTLQLNRFSISVQDLRDLQVETAARHGIEMNATSRFSRGVETRTPGSGRVHTGRAGRVLPARGERSGVKPPSPYPGYGAARRRSLGPAKAEAARRALADVYRRTAALMTTLGSAQRLAAALERAAADIEQGRRVGKEESMVERAARTAPETTDRELRAVSREIAALYEAGLRGIEGIADEAKRSKAERHLSNVMREFAPFVREEDRARIGMGLDYESPGRVSRTDPDAARQRHAAGREAREAVRKGRDHGEAGAVDPMERLAARIEARLEKADSDARSIFAQRGLNADVAMQRVRDLPNVNRATREAWMARDVEALSRSSNLSTREARERTVEAYRAAAEVYGQARGYPQHRAGSRTAGRP